MRMKNLIAILFLFSTSFLLEACVTSATVEGMTQTNFEGGATPNKKFQNAITVESVTGGSDTNPLWVSKISSDSFREALRQSLSNAGFGTSTQNARYVLVVTLENVVQPYFGFDMTVTTTINYILRDKQTKKILYNQHLISSHTATVGDAFMGTTRLRLANEGAARKNIGQLLSAIQGLSPDKVAVNLR